MAAAALVAQHRDRVSYDGNQPKRDMDADDREKDLIGRRNFNARNKSRSISHARYSLDTAFS
jgi:hypothetical protein